MVQPVTKAAAAADPKEQRHGTMGRSSQSGQRLYKSRGIPYHSIETLIVEAPDYGHVTTSEALSYYMWIEAMYGKFTGDFSEFEKAWDITEKYMIPTESDQPSASMAKYDPNSPATYAAEWEEPSMYPSELIFGAPVGDDPIITNSFRIRN